MKKKIVSLVSAVLAAAALAVEPENVIDTMFGVEVGRGSSLMGPSVPHGSVAPGPDTVWPSEGRPFPAPNGYWPGDKVDGFSMLHTQGTGGHPSYGIFRVRYSVGGEHLSSLEPVETHPYRFAASLPDLKAEVSIAATAHGAVFRFTRDGEPGSIHVDPFVKIGSDSASDDATVTENARADGTAEIFGGGTYSGNWNPAPYKCWFYAVREGGELRIAVSLRSVERAKEFYEAELKGRTLESVADAAKSAWREALSRVRVYGLGADEERIFYTSLRNAFLQPRDRTGEFAKFGDAPMWDEHHTLWDTWKTLFPLFAIVEPDVYAGVVDSFSARLRAGGCVASCFTQGEEYRVGQGGEEADAVIADAFARDVPGFDREAAWKVLERHAATRAEDYLRLGWVAADVKHPEYCWRMMSASGTIAYAFQDWCAASVAERLGKTEEAEALRRRSRNWRNVWDADAVDAPSGFKGFIKGRKSDGAFLATDPRKGYNTDFYEGTCWEYSFAIHHDIPALIELCGGRDRFAARLEYAFDNGLLDFGNEPCFQTTWLFDAVGRYDLACKWAEALRRKFTTRGTPGDDDSGAMGSMYVFLTAGLYPLAATDRYALHAPAAKRVEFLLDPATGRTFTVVNDCPAGELPTKITLDGEPLSEPYITHADVLSGKTLRFAR